MLPSYTFLFVVCPIFVGSGGGAQTHSCAKHLQAVCVFTAICIYVYVWICIYVCIPIYKPGEKWKEKRMPQTEGKLTARFENSTVYIMFLN